LRRSGASLLILETASRDSFKAVAESTLAIQRIVDSTG
jgi:hypothetical protein